MFAEFRHRLRLKSQRHCSLGELGERGRAKVTGHVRPGTKLLKAPLTGRECVFYALDVAEWLNGTKTPLIEEASTALFHVDDTTGNIAMDPSRVDLVLPSSLVRGHSSDYLAAHRALLKRHGYGMLDEFGELRSLTFHERIIAPGDKITALGSIRYESDPQGSAGYREQPRKHVLGADAKHALLLSDLD